MSGPVSTQDAPPEPAHGAPEPPEVEITPAREAQVGAFRVRRALPRRGRRTVGAWCFMDHMGPGEITAERGPDIGPHPHIGLQTVTWLLDGEILHRDSLGTELSIRPGQLNLMTAGHGVAHSEEGTGAYAGPIHGVQLWVAQPERTRHGAPAFEHHAELPEVELGGCRGTVMVGELAGVASPARRDTDHFGADLSLDRGDVDLPLHAAHEHAIVVTEGRARVDGTVVEPGQLAHVGPGREELRVEAAEAARLLLLGGTPFDGEVLMWWNFVARTREEITQARDDWAARSARFGTVASALPRTEVGPPPWRAPG